MKEPSLRELRFIALVAIAAVMLTGATNAPSNAWSNLRQPNAGQAEAIGAAANGCLAGAAQLPIDGVGYEVIKLSRRRYFGHPDTVDFVVQLGRVSQSQGLPIFYVGDMAQPRGGPLPFGHASHQTGLDVDIWFTLDTRPGLTPAQREEPALSSMVLASAAQIDPTHFSQRQVSLLRLAADDPRVDRIFVNPVIKLALCRGFGGATKDGASWLRRVRPWWGHDDHFHVRLRCPDDSPACEHQSAIPDGDGCDAALEDWAQHPKASRTFAPPTQPRKLPVACQAVLSQQ